MSEKNLRAKIIRLAHQKPELRKHLLPLVAEKTAKSDVDSGQRTLNKTLVQMMQSEYPNTMVYKDHAPVAGYVLFAVDRDTREIRAETMKNRSGSYVIYEHRIGKTFREGRGKLIAR